MKHRAFCDFMGFVGALWSFWPRCSKAFVILLMGSMSYPICPIVLCCFSAEEVSEAIYSASCSIFMSKLETRLTRVRQDRLGMLSHLSKWHLHQRKSSSQTSGSHLDDSPSPHTRDPSLSPASSNSKP